MYDFDALLDLRFKNQLCCEYVLVEDTQIMGEQTVLFHRGASPALGIRHWEWYVGE